MFSLLVFTLMVFLVLVLFSLFKGIVYIHCWHPLLSLDLLLLFQQ